MKKDCFTITPESGSNDGSIQVVCDAGSEEVNQVINVSGGGIIKTINITRKSEEYVEFLFTYSSKNDIEVSRKISVSITINNLFNPLYIDKFRFRYYTTTENNLLKTLVIDKPIEFNMGNIFIDESIDSSKVPLGDYGVIGLAIKLQDYTELLQSEFTKDLGLPLIFSDAMGILPYSGFKQGYTYSTYYIKSLFDFAADYESIGNTGFVDITTGFKEDLLFEYQQVIEGFILEIADCVSRKLIKLQPNKYVLISIGGSSEYSTIINELISYGNSILEVNGLKNNLLFKKKN